MEKAWVFHSHWDSGQIALPKQIVPAFFFSYKVLFHFLRLSLPSGKFAVWLDSTSMPLTALESAMEGARTGVLWPQK
jgi:hypothetical protein